MPVPLVFVANGQAVFGALEAVVPVSSVPVTFEVVASVTFAAMVVTLIVLELVARVMILVANETLIDFVAHLFVVVSFAVLLFHFVVLCAVGLAG